MSDKENNPVDGNSDDQTITDDFLIEDTVDADDDLDEDGMPRESSVSADEDFEFDLDDDHPPYALADINAELSGETLPQSSVDFDADAETTLEISALDAELNELEAADSEVVLTDEVTAEDSSELIEEFDPSLKTIEPDETVGENSGISELEIDSSLPKPAEIVSGEASPEVVDHLLAEMEQEYADSANTMAGAEEGAANIEEVAGEVDSDDMYAGLNEEMGGQPANPNLDEFGQADMLSAPTVEQEDMIEQPYDDGMPPFDEGAPQIEDDYMQAQMGDQNYGAEEAEPTKDLSRMFDDPSDDGQLGAEPDNQEDFGSEEPVYSETGGLAEDAADLDGYQDLEEAELDVDEIEEAYEYEEELEVESDDHLEEIDEDAARDYAEGSGVESADDAVVAKSIFKTRPNNMQIGILSVGAILTAYFAWGSINKNNVRSNQNQFNTVATSKPTPVPVSVSNQTAAPAAEPVTLTPEQQRLVNSVGQAVNNQSGRNPVDEVVREDRGISPISKRNSADIDETLAQSRASDAKILKDILDRLRTIDTKQSDLNETDRRLVNAQEALTERLATIQKSQLALAQGAQQPKRVAPYGAQISSNSYAQDTYVQYRRATYGNKPTQQESKSVKKVSEQEVIKLDLKPVDPILALSSKPIHPQLRVVSATNQKAVIINASCKRTLYKVGDKVGRKDKIIGILSGDVYTTNFRIPQSTYGC